jgi:hypothetical protein
VQSFAAHCRFVQETCGGAFRIRGRDEHLGVFVNSRNLTGDSGDYGFIEPSIIAIILNNDCRPKLAAWGPDVCHKREHDVAAI